MPPRPPQGFAPPGSHPAGPPNAGQVPPRTPGNGHPGAPGTPWQAPFSPGAQQPSAPFGPAGHQEPQHTPQQPPDTPQASPSDPDGRPPVAMRHVDPSTYGVPESKVVYRDVPGWTRDENALYRGDTRSPDEIRAAGGFDVPGPGKAPDLLRHVDGDTNAYVSTTTDQTVAKERAGTGAMYVIKAPGGIETDSTLDAVGHDRRYGESEVLFPGGVDWRYVAGWHEVRYQPGSGFVPGPFVPNPDYIGDRDPSPTSRPDTTSAQNAQNAQDRQSTPDRQDTQSSQSTGGGTDTRPGTVPTQAGHADRGQPAAHTPASHHVGPTRPMASPQPGHGPTPTGHTPHTPQGQQQPGRPATPHTQPAAPHVQPAGQHTQPAGQQHTTAPRADQPWTGPARTDQPWTSPRADQPERDTTRPGQAQNPPWQQPPAQQPPAQQHPTQQHPAQQPPAQQHDPRRDWMLPQQAPQQPHHESFGPTPTPHPDRSPSPTPEQQDRTDPTSADRTQDRPQDRTQDRPQDRPQDPAPQRPQRPLADRLGSLDDELDRNVRDHVHSTPAGMSIYDRGQDKNQYYTAQELPRIPGRFVVDVHGSPDSARVGRYPLSPKDVADIIRANPDWNGDPITLVGCETGRRDDGFAAQLARELGVPVTAPNTDAWVDYNGNLFASNTVDGEHPGWPPNGEWRTFGPDGSQDISESPYPPGHTPEWGDEPGEHAPSTAERRGEREDDFRELREENKEKRNEGLESVRELTGRNPMTDADRRPHERTLSTARYRSDRTGESEDFYNYSGKAHDWSPAAEAPQRPPKNERVFETSYARSYDPVSGGWREGEGSNRVHDSEPKMFEDLARHQLAEHSGLSRDEVDRALRDAVKVVDTIDKADENHYRNGFKGEVQRTQDRIELAIDELNKRAAAKAAENGTTYTPFTAADISGDLRMVVDLPSAKRDGTPPDYQICLSCQKVMLAYERVFPNMRLEVVNRAGERLYPL